jgi:capsular polysaccharide transport system ATP-binding protein
MFELHNVWKEHRKPGQDEDWILKDVTVQVPVGGRIALLGSDRNANSMVLRLLSGVVDPDKGAVRRVGKPCWPFDYANFLDSKATLRQNATFLARVYGVEADEVARIAIELSGVRAVRGKLMGNYLAVDRKALQLGLTLALQFDHYFVDERLPKASPETLAKIDAAIADRTAGATVVWATTRPETVAGYCDAGLVLDQGSLTFYTDFTEAAEAYSQIADNEARTRNVRKPRDPNRRRRSARRQSTVDTEKPR